MSAIFGMFRKCLHTHMVIYWNLTQNITKGQRWVKKGQKGVEISGILKNMISYPNYGTYECNFWHVSKMFAYAYGNLQEFDPKYNQGSKMGQKVSKKGAKTQKKDKKGPKQVQNGKSFKKLIDIPFYHNFLYNTHKLYIIHYFNHTHVIRGY